MQATVIPSATKDTLRVPKLKRGVDGKLEFKVNSPESFIGVIEIFYFEKSLGKYHTENLNNMILVFFQKLARLNNGIVEGVEEKLENLEKIYQINKDFVDQQLSNAENFRNKELLKKQIEQNFISYPIEYTNLETKNVIGLSEKQNIIQFTCDKYDLKLKDLANAIGVKESSLRAFASNNKISTQVETAIHLYIENIELKKELKKINCNVKFF